MSDMQGAGRHMHFCLKISCCMQHVLAYDCIWTLAEPHIAYVCMRTEHLHHWYAAGFIECQICSGRGRRICFSFKISCCMQHVLAYDCIWTPAEPHIVDVGMPFAGLQCCRAGMGLWGSGMRRKCGICSRMSHCLLHARLPEYPAMQPPSDSISDQFQYHSQWAANGTPMC
jgi:hypothetical protein